MSSPGAVAAPPCAPTAALPGELPVTPPLRVVPCFRARPASALLVELEAWRRFATAAADARLRSLQFAVSADRRCLVRGRPVPPIDGQRWLDDGGIAVPCGCRWDPPVDCDVLRGLFGTGPGDLVLLCPDRPPELLRDEFSVGASRSAVRNTRQELGRG